jgi:hypothetical protein
MMTTQQHPAATGNREVSVARYNTAADAARLYTVKEYHRRDGTVSAVYPACCTSAYCGSGSAACSSCQYAPVLASFRAWVERNHAAVSDPIWSPLVYVAKR